MLDTPQFEPPQLYVAPNAAQQLKIIMLTTALQQALEFADKVADCRITFADVDAIQDHQAALDRAMLEAWAQ